MKAVSKIVLLCLLLGLTSSNFSLAQLDSQFTDVLDKSDIMRLISAEKETTATLVTLQNRIRRAHTDYSIAKTVGSGVSIAGSVAGIAGLALAPFTFGWSLGLTAVGFGSVVAGSSVSLTTSIVETAKAEDWAGEFEEALEKRAKELMRIGEKIESSSTLKRWAMLGGKIAMYSAFKIPAARMMYKVADYLRIMGPEYGRSGLKYISLPPWLENVPLSKTVNRQAQPLYFARKSLPLSGLMKENHWLTKVIRSGTGLNMAKLGVKTLSVLGYGVAVVGIAVDIYSIVDTWTSSPAQAEQIGQIVQHLRESTRNLEEHLSTFY